MTWWRILLAIFVVWIGGVLIYTMGFDFSDKHEKRERVIASVILSVGIVVGSFVLILVILSDVWSPIWWQSLLGVLACILIPFISSFCGEMLTILLKGTVFGVSGIIGALFMIGFSVCMWLDVSLFNYLAVSACTFLPITCRNISMENYWMSKKSFGIFEELALYYLVGIVYVVAILFFTSYFRSTQFQEFLVKNAVKTYLKEESNNGKVKIVQWEDFRLLGKKEGRFEGFSQPYTIKVTVRLTNEQGATVLKSFLFHLQRSSLWKAKVIEFKVLKSGSVLCLSTSPNAPPFLGVKSEAA